MRCNISIPLYEDTSLEARSPRAYGVMGANTSRRRLAVRDGGPETVTRWRGHTRIMHASLPTPGSKLTSDGFEIGTFAPHRLLSSCTGSVGRGTVPHRAMLIHLPRTPVPVVRLERPARDGNEGVTTYLLIELRKANRTIERLREVALAARDGDSEKLRAALARLWARDLKSVRPRSRRGAGERQVSSRS
jgi:hypothetical protein